MTAEREPGIGTRERPLTLAEMPFTVPVTGRYFVLYADRVIEMPESPAGSVIDLEDTQ